MNDNAKYTATFIAGAAIGAAIVLLLTKENREKIQDLLYEKADTLIDLLEAELEKANTLNGNKIQEQDG